MKTTPHNPAGLTKKQVGQKPWRLLHSDEIKNRAETHSEIQCWLSSEDGWSSTHWIGNDHDCTYRTNLTRRQLARLY